MNYIIESSNIDIDGTIAIHTSNKEKITFGKSESDAFMSFWRKKTGCNTNKAPFSKDMVITCLVNTNQIKSIVNISSPFPMSVLKYFSTNLPFKPFADIALTHRNNLITSICNQINTLDDLFVKVLKQKCIANPITEFIKCLYELFEFCKNVCKLGMFCENDTTGTILPRHVSALTQYFANIMDKDIDAFIFTDDDDEDDEYLHDIITYERFLSDPYLLIGRCKGVPFNVIDIIAVQLDIPFDIRLIANICNAIRELMDQFGHVYVTASDVLSIIRKTKFPDVSGVGYDIMISTMISQMHNKTIFYNTEHEIYIKNAYYQQINIVNYLHKLIDYSIDCNKTIMNWAEAQTLIHRFEKLHSIKLHDNQLSTIQAFVSGQMLIALAGGPGCGKSTIISLITEIAKACHLTVAQLAPTGKAAARLSNGQTIHRIITLLYQDIDTSVQFILKDELGKVFLNHDIIIVDETSMLDLTIANKLFKAYSGPRLHRWIFIGDDDQLPPVSYGCFFKDLLQSIGPCHVKLTKTFRQGKESPIPLLASYIRKGLFPPQDLLVNKYIKFIDLNEDNGSKAPAIRKYIVNMCLKQYTNDKTNDFQIICAVKDKGDNCTFEFNKDIHIALYGDEGINLKIKTIQPVPGEKVIVVKNYYSTPETNGKVKMPKHLVACNGDVGTFNSYRSQGDKVYANLTLQKGNDVDVPLENVQLAHAISVHKSQGSEYDTVVVVADKAGGRLLSRELLYTAITRAKKTLYIVSDEATMRKCVAFTTPKRNSKLADLISAPYDEV